jgi:hypothetical protein
VGSRVFSKRRSATFYKWQAKYGGMDITMITRMKELEAENARLKKMYAEERLKAEILGRSCITRPMGAILRSAREVSPKSLTRKGIR